jgi:probable F420-dependent oxidoreductase
MPTMTWRQRLGTVGVWRGVQAVRADLAVDIEGLGYGAIWLGGSPRSDLHAAEALLAATHTVTIATGIVNIWRSDPSELADAYHRIVERHPGRLLLGIGSGHREAIPERTRPIEAMSRYLDVLDERGVPKADRVLSALGPRMLELAAERSGGTHPYLTVAAQTWHARIDLGQDLLVAPELTVVLDIDEARARGTARDFIANYLRTSNYSTNMQRAGFTSADLENGGSDRLIDEIVAHGNADSVAAGIRAHLDAGADHVCIQVLPAADDVLPALRAVSAETGLFTAA